MALSQHQVSQKRTRQAITRYFAVLIHPKTVCKAQQSGADKQVMHKRKKRQH
jgi:hypothetical protein